MAEPLSYQLLVFLKARLQQITVANGFLTDLGSGVVAIDEDDVPATGVPCAVVAVGPFEVSETVSSTVLSEIATVAVEYSVPRTTGNDAGLLAQRARVDLVRALQFKERDLPPGLAGFRITGADIANADESSGRRYAVAQVTARVGLTQRFQPAPPPTPPSP